MLLRYAMWRGANALVAGACVFLAVGSASIHFLARPHLFTLLLLPICLWMVEADRRNHTRWIWLLVPLTALWTNLHGGFLVFLVLLGTAGGWKLDRGAARKAALGGGAQVFARFWWHARRRRS